MEEESAVAMKTGVEFLRIVSPFYFVVSLKLVSDGVLRGSSAMKEFMVGTFADLILRVGFSFLLAGMLGEMGVWLSWPIGWSVGTVLAVYYTRKVMKRMKQRQNQL